jgi:hypothetical protein
MIGAPVCHRMDDATDFATPDRIPPRFLAGKRHKSFF